jgi:hypothetical protein
VIAEAVVWVERQEVPTDTIEVLVYFESGVVWRIVFVHRPDLCYSSEDFWGLRKGLSGLLVGDQKVTL